MAHLHTYTCVNIQFRHHLYIYGSLTHIHMCKYSLRHHLYIYGSAPLYYIHIHQCRFTSLPSLHKHKYRPAIKITTYKYGSLYLAYKIFSRILPFGSNTHTYSCAVILLRGQLWQTKFINGYSFL